MLLNKAPLIELWKRFPNHPLLLETHAYDAQAHYAGKWVRKPILAREGANIHILQKQCRLWRSPGSFTDDYDKYAYVMQRWVKPVV